MSVQTKIQDLGDRWGLVRVTYHPDHFEGQEWTVANHTDEGLGPPGEKRRVQASTLTDALDKALAQEDGELREA